VVIYDHDTFRGNELPRSIHTQPFGFTATVCNTANIADPTDGVGDVENANAGLPRWSGGCACWLR